MITDAIERVTYTADGIHAAASAYNAQYPEAEADIAAGTPIVQIMQTAVDNGWKGTVTVTPAIRAVDGGLIGAGEARVFGPMRVFRMTDPLANARWIAKKTVDAADVEIVITH